MQMKTFRLKINEPEGGALEGDLPSIDYVCQASGPAKGRAYGTGLLLLHGFTGCKENWDRLVERLSSKRCVIAIDLLGHGESRAPTDARRYRMAQAAADLADVVNQLYASGTVPSKKMDLLGYSMGGRLALFFALEYPQWVRRLVLESASPGLASEAERQQRRKSDEALAEMIERDGIEAFVRGWENMALFSSQSRLPHEVRQKLREQRLHSNPVGLANSLRGMGSGVQPALWERLVELKMPVQLIAGELDTKFTAINRQVAAGIPSCQLEVIAGAGHTVHLEQFDVFAEKVTSFLDCDL
jgi:2-succinyl-6-hydroxy-2,4-cyclohexadiene-1-carboxylate synthase